MELTNQYKTLRLLMPQWQGGDYDITPASGDIYPMGARLMAFLAPKNNSPLIEVPIEPYTKQKRPTQNGVVWQEVLLQQLKTATKIINENQPDRIITFGGDCLVSQAPFSYLNERYQENIGILWIDAHPDISTPENRDREHAMVLGNLLGRGDPFFAKEVKIPYKKEQILMIGIDKYDSPYEEEMVKKLGLTVTPINKIIDSNETIINWMHKNSFDNIAIHLDLDVLDPTYFYSQLTKNPYVEPFDTKTGKITIAQLTRIIKEVSNNSNVVGITFAEHMPWDALNLKNMMDEFSFMKE